MVDPKNHSSITRSIRRAASVTLLALLIILVLPVAPIVQEHVSALSDDQKEAFQLNINYFDTEKRGCLAPSAVPATNIPANSSGSVAKVLGGEVGKKVYQYSFNKLIADGVTAPDAAAQAAGILGNFMWESHLDPAIISGPAHGLGQWEGGRWSSRNGLEEYAKRRDRETGQSRGWQNADIQLDFTWFELKGSESSAYALLKKTKTPKEAATVFSEKFERPGIPHLDKRIEYAGIAYSIYGKSAIALASTAASQATNAVDASSSCVGSCTGTDTSYCWPIAPQTKRNYIGAPCPGPNEIPGYGARGYVGYYTNEYGVKSSGPIRTCHHLPLSAAFDLYYGPNDKNGTPIGAAGKPIYAITKGVIERVNESYCNPSSCNASGQRCNSLNFHSTLDGYWYWYGHVVFDKKNISKGKEVSAGTPIGVVAPVEYGAKCWGGAPHLHIDRGCVDKSGQKHPGGGADCRDPDFLKVMMDMWKELPEGHDV